MLKCVSALKMVFRSSYFSKELVLVNTSEGTAVLFPISDTISHSKEWGETSFTPCLTYKHFKELRACVERGGGRGGEHDRRQVFSVPGGELTARKVQYSSICK